MSRDFWRHVWLAFTNSGPYDPTGRDQEIVRLRGQLDRSLMLAARGEAPNSGSAADRHMRYTLALIRAHQRIYGTWPPAERVERALDALEVPHEGTVLGPPDDSHRMHCGCGRRLPCRHCDGGDAS